MIWRAIERFFDVGPPTRHTIPNSKWCDMKKKIREKNGGKKSYKSISKYGWAFSLSSCSRLSDTHFRSASVIRWCWVHICRYVYLSIKWNYEPNTHTQQQQSNSKLPEKKISYEWVDEWVRIMRNVFFSEHFNTLEHVWILNVNCLMSEYSSIIAQFGVNKCINLKNTKWRNNFEVINVYLWMPPQLHFVPTNNEITSDFQNEKEAIG